MTDVDTEFVEPEFWTILKTPYRRKNQIPAYVLTCDGISDSYGFCIVGSKPDPTISVTVTDGTTQVCSSTFALYTSGTLGNIRFASPPSAGSIITVYFHE